MSTWSDGLVRGHVLRGGDADTARPARMDAELRNTAYAPRGGVDARLTDPMLVAVVERARCAAAEAGRAAGHAEGYAAGQAAAAADATRTAAATERVRLAEEQHRSARVDDAVRVLLGAADSFRRQEQLVLADIEDVVGDLAVSIARAVVGRELALSADRGAEAIARALVLAPDGCPATVRLHPDDLADLESLGAVAAGRELVLVADPTVEPGGCVVESAGRHIDAQVGPALERVAAVLR